VDYILVNNKVDESLRTQNATSVEGSNKSRIWFLSKSCRVFNSHHFGPFPVEKYSILTILEHFLWGNQSKYGLFIYFFIYLFDFIYKPRLVQIYDIKVFFHWLWKSKWILEKNFEFNFLWIQKGPKEFIEQ